MARLQDEVLGCYVTSFFEMHVDTYKDDLSPSHLPLGDMTVLFHEYIHFLQDFTTYYGLNKLYVYSEYLHSIVNRIYNIKGNDIHIPFEINDNNDNVLLNRQLMNFTEGDTENSDTYKIHTINVDYDPLISNPYMNLIPSIVLNIDGEIRSFGAVAISENMAYLMERLCSPKGVVTSPDFPYKAAELVSDYYVKGFSDDSYKVLALCDTSLQSSNPGLYYVRVMKGIKSGDLHFNTPEEIYDHFYSQIGELPDRTRTSFISQFPILLEQVRKCFKSYLRDMPITEQYYKWIDNLLNFALDWRLNNRYFLLRMAHHSDLPTNPYWKQALDAVGSPLMTNNLRHHFKIPQKNYSGGMDVEYFKAIRQIESLFEFGTVECELFNWCQQSHDVNANELCQTTPWMKCTEKRLCPYALLWKHWKLCGKYPVK